jgi:glycosyltransferase involved in cell wall biosynthesis
LRYLSYEDFTHQHALQEETISEDYFKTYYDMFDSSGKAMKLLHIIGTLNPDYGGPVVGLNQLVYALETMGHSNEVLTLDPFGCDWLADFPVSVHTLGPSLGKYCYTPRLVPWLRKNSASYDAVIVNGIWQYQSLGVWLASRKTKFSYYVFVHGALDPWFKHQYPMKHLKKWLYWPWAEYQVLRDARAVLFTSEEEKQLAAQSFWLYRANEEVVHYGIVPPPSDSDAQLHALLHAFPALKGKRILLFLGRIHPKKGCDLLLQAFANIAPTHPEVMLVVAGPDAENWRPTLENLANNLGIAQKILWTGFISGDLKWGMLRAADAFVLPSHSENFGVAVVEALACGTPVLISDKINIWKEINAAQAGLIAPDTQDGTTSLLEKWYTLGTKGQALLRANAHSCFERHFEIKASATQLVATIQKTLPTLTA